MWRFGDGLIKRIYLTEAEPRSGAVKREGWKGGKSSEAEREATPGIKLLHVCIFSASPAVTPDLQEPSALVVFISPSKQQGRKDPANKRLEEQTVQGEPSCPTQITCRTSSSFIHTPRFEEKEKMLQKVLSV